MERADRAATRPTPVFQAGYALAAIPARYALERRAGRKRPRSSCRTAKLAWDRFPYALA